LLACPAKRIDGLRTVDRSPHRDWPGIIPMFRAAACFRPGKQGLFLTRFLDAKSVSASLENGLVVLTRFLDANRYPLRLKTL